MATTPTQNSVPSESPIDLKFNAGKIDEFVTSLALQYLDRFGSAHYTIEGLRWLAQQAIAQFGWIPVESFQAGATISLPNQILKDTSTGEYYRWDGSLPKVVPAGSTPSSTGGTGVGAWISVGDSALRSMLAANDGEKLIGECPTIAILRTIEPTVDKQRITLKEHTAGTRKGGGQFRAVLNGAAYTDNNGTVIKTAGGSAWLRINADILNPLMFGAIGDGVANDAAAVNSALATGVSVNLVGLTYLTSGTPIRMDVITGRQELYGGIIKDGSVGNNNILSVGGTNKTVRNLTESPRV